MVVPSDGKVYEKTLLVKVPNEVLHTTLHERFFLKSSIKLAFNT